MHACDTIMQEFQVIRNVQKIQKNPENWRKRSASFMGQDHPRLILHVRVRIAQSPEPSGDEDGNFQLEALQPLDWQGRHARYLNMTMMFTCLTACVR